MNGFFHSFAEYAEVLEIRFSFDYTSRYLTI
jgi:hypothetical protein